jgi:hypothetical protein
MKVLFFFWLCWDLNSGLLHLQSSALLLEPHL